MDKLLTSRDAGLDIVEQVLESCEVGQYFKTYACFIAHRALFDNEIAARLSCEEMAVASILATCDLLGDFRVLETVPSSLLTDRAAEGAAALRQLARSRECTNPPIPLSGAIPSVYIYIFET
jgi:hypothetical protein